MTNFEAWHFFTKDLVAPDSFITMSYYSMISTALQRRVYLGSDDRPLFANQFVILIGPPGVGKGEAMKPVLAAVKHHKLVKMRIVPEEQKTSEDQAAALAALLAEMERANDKEPNGAFKKLSNMKDPLMFPVASNCTTYEALVKTHAQSLRSIFPTGDKNSRLLKSGLYTHSSLAFILEEISSLFRKHSEDTIQYLITAFDCNDYENTTIGRGTDKVLSPCLNFLGGTTPAFVRDSFSTRLLSDGFASRVLFIFEERNRFYREDVSTISDEQRAAHQQVIDHLGKLGTLFGLVTFSPEAKAFIKHYIEVVIGENQQRTNNDPKLLSYYSRKNIHIKKLIMAMHFSETMDMVIQLPTCLKAVELLDSLERKMHMALDMAARNPMQPVAARVQKALENGPMTKPEIWAMFFAEISTETELAAVIEFLTASGKAKLEIIEGKSKYKLIK